MSRTTFIIIYYMIYDLHIISHTIAIIYLHNTLQLYIQKEEENTHLKCSLVIDALPAKILSKNTTRVVKTENKAPNPKTTRYPTVNDSGDSPPK